MTEVFKNKGHQGVRDQLHKHGWSVAAVVAILSVALNLWELPARRAVAESLQSIAEKLESHSLSIAKLQEWANGGPKYTTAVGENLKAAAVTEAVRQASLFDGELKRDIAALRDGQMSLANQLSEFRERWVSQNAEMKASINYTTQKLDEATRTSGILANKITDVLVKLDNITEKGTK